MRICLLVDPLDEQYAGVYTYTKSLTKALLELDAEHEFILVHSRPNAEITRWVQERKAPTQEVMCRNPRWLPGWPSFRKFVRLPWLFRKLKPDVIFEPAHIGPFSWWWSAKKVVTIHDLTPVLFPEHHIWISRVVHKLLLPKIINGADGVIVPSEATKKDVQEHYHSKSIRKIAEAADDIFRPVPNDRPAVFLKHGIQSRYVLSVGTLEPRKQLDVLVKAFERLEQDDLQLVLVGKKGWYFDELMKGVSDSAVRDRIVVTGYVDQEDLPALYSHAEVMVYPSLYEGFGLPPLEAMQSGCPVICSDASSLPEVVGGAGKLVPPGDQEALRKALQAVLSDEKMREQMSQKGLEQAKKFRWQHAARETLDYFQTLDTHDSTSS